MKIRSLLACTIIAFLFYSCDSSDGEGGESWPSSTGFNFGGNQYNILTSRHSYLGEVSDVDKRSSFIIRFTGNNSSSERMRSVVLYLLADDQSATRLPVGSYVIETDDSEGNRCGEATFITPSQEEPMIATRGKVTVELEDNIYVIRGDFWFEGDYNLKVYYRGLPSYKDNTIVAEENEFLYDGTSYNIRYARQVYLGESPESNFASAFNLRFTDAAATSSSANTVMIYLLANSTDEQIQSGTYPARIRQISRSNAGECWQATFFPVNGNEPYLAADGTVTVSMDEDIYDIKANITFENKYRLNLHYNGEMEYHILDDHDHDHQE